MEYKTTQEAPAKALSRIEAQMTSLGYTTDMRSETSLTMSRHAQMDFLTKVIFLGMVLFTLGLALLLLIVWSQLKVKVTFTAFEEEGETKVHIGGSQQGYNDAQALLKQSPLN